MASTLDSGSRAIMTHPTAYLRGYITWARRLPQATGIMFTARSRLGRSCKIILYGVGVVLPLGSLIWALLFWHGRLAIAAIRAQKAWSVVNAEKCSPRVGLAKANEERLAGFPWARVDYPGE